MLVRYSASFICAVFFITGAVSGEDKAVGDTVSFRPAEIVPPVTSIIWKHKSSTGPVVKAIEWDTDDGKIIPNQRFKDITSLDEKTGVITITNLTVEHSGLYTIDINSKEQEQRFTLTVIERVPKPKITIDVSSKADGVLLRCDYSGKIIWKNSTGETVEDKKTEITVKNTGNPENFYTCTLKNAVSVETSDPVYERELFGTVAGLIAGIVIFVILLIIISLICIYLLKMSIYDCVNARCPCIKSVLRYVDCCKKKREQYVLAPTEMRPEAVSPVNHENDETIEVAVIPVNHENDETREGAVIPVNQENDETTKVAVSQVNHENDETREGAVIPVNQENDETTKVVVSPVNHENDETREGAVIPVNHENDETREGAVIPVNQENDETTKVAVSPDQNDVHENNSDSTQSK